MLGDSNDSLTTLFLASLTAGIEVAVESTMLFVSCADCYTWDFA